MQWSCTIIFIIILRDFFHLQLNTKEVESKNQVLAEINHEQRAQLNGIESCTNEILLEIKKKDYSIMNIKNTANKMKKINKFQMFLVSDFLDSNRITMNTFSLN